MSMSRRCGSRTWPARPALRARLREAWRRYGMPLAVTEVHHGCTRERAIALVRGMLAHRPASCAPKAMDLRAVTLWSLFGHYDWRSLLTRRDGVLRHRRFDVRGGHAPADRDRQGRPQPSPAARTSTIRCSTQPGWWRRPERLYAWQGGARQPGRRAAARCSSPARPARSARRWRGSARSAAFPSASPTRAELDICDERSIEAALAAPSRPGR